MLIQLGNMEECAFKDIAVGETFMWENCLCMCMESLYTGPFTAVGLEDGSTYSFEDNDMVRPFPCKVVSCSPCET